LLHQQFPLVTTDPNKLEEQAKSKLPPTSYNYVAGGAGEKATMDANRLAFRQWKMVPRMLSGFRCIWWYFSEGAFADINQGPTTQRDLRIKLFGETYGNPATKPTIYSGSENLTRRLQRVQFSWLQ
jgi:isopentenyl diphosphate isomerase/L-lactate dehydrogenase-like FMN-dependent dehydrogenase